MGNYFDNCLIIFMIIMDQMMCFVKGVTHSDELTDNYHLTLLSIMASFNASFWFPTHNFTVLIGAKMTT